MALGHCPGYIIDHFHDHAPVHRAEEVGVQRRHDPRQCRLCRRGRPAWELGDVRQCPHDKADASFRRDRSAVYDQWHIGGETEPFPDVGHGPGRIDIRHRHIEDDRRNGLEPIMPL
jgi:hypothetical protein